MSAAPEPVRASPPAVIVLISVQLVLALLVVRQFHLESQTFFQVMLLGAAGFVVHALLPLRHRLPFFAVLSVAALPLALGPKNGLFVFLLGLVLIGICHLPARLPVRVVLLLLVGALCAAWRMEALPAPWSVVIWPVLASMFMFRLALYLYALKHDDAPRSPSRTLAYFFMLPNVCFPLFPVVDYSLFTRTHYDGDESRIYQTGIKWIARGLVHLVLYRLVYLNLTSDPAHLLTLGDLVVFLLATFLLYLRVSGQFHLITGLLHLFGFRLPETHHLYFLAPSFTDFWRRINIYWKDFMMKLVYFPSFFRLRRRGNRTALIGATILVFFVTWILHSYQWFWLRGGFPVELQDALFWGFLGALVVIGALREMARPRQRTLAPETGWSLSRAARVVATFAAICVLWSLWSASSVSGWLTMWMVVGNPAPGDLGMLAVLLLAGLVIAGKAWGIRETDDAAPRPWHRRAAVPTAALVGLLILGTPTLYAGRSPRLAAAMTGLQTSTLNATDAALRHRGYYEKLDNQSRMSAQLWESESLKPPTWVGLSSTGAYRRRNDFMIGDLKPDSRITFMDQPLVVNRWGMRDRDMTLEKPAGTFRIAMLGPSHVMGSGVADGETFSDLLEERLNQALPSGSPTRFEVLNFGVAGSAITQQLMMLHDRAIAFHPDIVVLTGASELKEDIIKHLLEVVSHRTPIPFPGLDSLVRRAGVRTLGNPEIAVPFRFVRSTLEGIGIATRIPWPEAERRLRMMGDSLTAWTLRQIAMGSREAGAAPVFVGLNVVEDLQGTEVLRAARDAGFLVFDLFGFWAGQDKAAVRLHPSDLHPNPAGHRLIADRLFELLNQHRAELRLPNVPPTDRNPAQ